MREKFANFVCFFSIPNNHDSGERCNINYAIAFTMLVCTKGGFLKISKQPDSTLKKVDILSYGP